jgi:hypothetical protein
VSAAPTTQLSLRHLRELYAVVEVVEHWKRNPVTGIQTKHDLFGFIDILALGNDEIVGVQTTTQDHLAAHVRKIVKAPTFAAVVASGIRVVIHGWHQPNGPRTHWALEEFDLTTGNPVTPTTHTEDS